MNPQTPTLFSEIGETNSLNNLQEQIRRRAFVPPSVLRYKSGEEIKKGDLVFLRGNPAKIEALFCDARRIWRGAVVVWDLIASSRTIIRRAQLDNYEDLEFVSRSES
jgi:hypothetical protein